MKRSGGKLIMTNTCKFNGNLTKDAQFTVTPNGKNLYKFTLATTTGKPKMENGQPVKNGDKTVYEVMYVDFAAFGNVAESLVNGSLHPNLAKGAFVKVEARFDGVNAYLKQDGTTPAGSANFVITSPLDVSILGISSNKREDGATYQPKARSNNQQSNQQGQQGGYSNNPNQQYDGQQQQFSGQQQFGGQQQFSGQQQFGGQQQQFGGQQHFGGGYEDPNGNFPY